MRQLVTLGLEKLAKSTVQILRSILPRGPHRTTRVGFWVGGSNRTVRMWNST